MLYPKRAANPAPTSAIPLPPRDLMLTVGNSTSEEFVKIGDNMVKSFRTLVGLKPTARVLDVGCGCGRVARPLTGLLTNRGSYEGMDISRRQIDWCQREITSRFANFRFQYADIHNSAYNPAGGVRAAEYSFPFAAASFDFVFLASVFTHMLPDAVDRYLSEISRVLRPRGRALITYFLLDGHSRAAIHAGGTKYVAFVPAGDDAVCWTSRPAVPEQAVALDEGFVIGLHQRHHLRIDRIHRGQWAPGRGTFRSSQDMVVATRVAGA